MSLINDALKRANKTPKRNPPPGPTLTTMQPVESARKGGGSSYLIPVLLVVVLGLAGTFLWLWAKSAHRTSTVAVNKVSSERSAVPEPQPVAHTPVAPNVVAKAPATTQPQAGTGPTPTKYGIKISTNLVVRTNPTPKLPPAEAVAAAPEPVAATPELVAAVEPPAVAPTAPAPAPVVAAVLPAPEAPKAVSLPAPPPPKPEFPTVKLQGIFFRQANPSVLINGKTLRTGERIEGVKIVKIERENVTLEWSGQTRIVSMDQ